MSCGSIYKIVFPNGKHYIGLTTTSLEQRTKQHRSSAKRGDTKVLYKALRKYDMVDTFELIEIDTADTNEELCELEILYILEYNSYYLNENGYNMTFGGEGFNGYVRTEEDNLKNSERRKKYYEDNPNAAKEYGEKMKQYYIDNPHAGKEHGEKMKQYYIDNPDAGKEYGEKMKQYYEDNPDARQQMSKIKKKYYEDNPDSRQECSERTKKYFEDNPDARSRMSEKMKKYYEDNPDARSRMSETKKKYNKDNPQVAKEQGERRKQYYKDNPDAIKQMSESAKKYYEEHPTAGKEHGEKMKKYYEDNPEVKLQIARQIADTKGQNKPFDVSKTDGTFIKTFTYQFEAIEYLRTEHNITSTIKIGEVLRGQRGNSAGFVFKYK